MIKDGWKIRSVVLILMIIMYNEMVIMTIMMRGQEDQT